jgi:hypothetical protein
VRRHGVSSPKTKTRSEKDAELEKLYRYYVGRVHEVYDNHCRHHRLLFRGDICLRWETPEKVTLLEEDDLGPGLTPSSSRAITPLSQRNSGSWRALLASSRAPTPHSTKASESRRDVDSTEINEGKRKDVDPGLDADVGSHVGGVDGDKAKDKDVDTSTLSSTANTAPKSNKSNKSTIQRLRQLWPTTKARESSADDVELVLEGKKDNGNEETEAQEREQEQEPVV